MTLNSVSRAPRRSRWLLLCASASLALQNAAALIVERPCCSLMTHVSGEFTDFDMLADAPVAATELVPVTPFLACEPLATPHVAGRIALVQRGGCNFVKKVWHAQQAGAVGVVVMDAARRDEAPYHIIMQKDENATRLTIPAAFVSYGDGEKLLRHIAKAVPWSPVLVTLSEFGELPHDRTKFRLVKRAIAYVFLVSAVCALSSGLSIISSFLFNMVGKVWRTRVTKKLPLLRYRPLLQRELLDHALREVDVLDRIILEEDDDEDDATHHGHGHPLSVFGDDLVHSSLGSDAESCSICLDDFATGERVKVLPCQHFFHVDCIDPWLEKHSGRCPLCKQDAIAAIDDAPKSLFGFTLPPLEQVLRQEHWFHTFFLMLPASLVSCLIVNSAASIIRSLWP